MNIDVILVSEQNQTCNPSWLQDLNKKSAIVNHKGVHIDETGNPLAGFTSVRLADTWIYPCYWTPRPDLASFADFLLRLELSIRSRRGEVIVCGDLNAHHSLWGCHTNDNKRDLLPDVIQTLGMVVCNKGTEVTFQSCNRSSIIDITLTTQRAANKILNWRVLDTTSLSDHNYIHFSMEDSENT